MFTEQKISELSSTIGDYEKGRYEDQTLINKLKRKLENQEDSSVQQQQQKPLRTRTNEFDYDLDNDFGDDNDRDRKPGSGNSVLEKIRTSSSDEYAKYFDSGKALYCEFKVSVILKQGGNSPFSSHFLRF